MSRRSPTLPVPPAARFYVLLIVVVTLTCSWLTVSAAILRGLQAGGLVP